MSAPGIPAYEPPPEHPVSDVVTAWNDGRLIVLVVFKRIGLWAITQVAHAGDDRFYPPWLGVPALTWFGEDHEYGRNAGNFIGYSDQETEILEALQPFTPDDLRAAGGKSLLRADLYLDTDTVLAIKR